MADGRRGAALDLFRLAAGGAGGGEPHLPAGVCFPIVGLLVHPGAGPVAVPFFLRSAAIFCKGPVAQDGVFLKKTCLLYGAAVLLYLPLNWYNGG